MRLVFAGTPAFAQVALAALAAAGHDIVGVMTQPDRPAGRGMKLQASPVKQWALAHGIAIAQPAGLKLDGRHAQEAAAQQALLRAWAPEAMVVAAYGLILPAWALEAPRWGCLNIHASLLPRWRGAAPIHRAIEAGDAETGISIMQMDEGLDTGNVLRLAREPIHADDTTGSLHDRLAALGGQQIVEALALLAQGALAPAPQPADGVSYAAKIDKAEAAIDWRQPARTIERRLRAFDPFPGASFSADGKLAKLWRGQVVPGRGAPGEVLVAGDRPVVACGEEALALDLLQHPGGRRVGAREWLAGGGALSVGQRLGLPTTG